MNANQVAVAASCVVLSLLAAFFLVFNGLFSDGPSDPAGGQRLVMYALILAGYGLLGATGSRLARAWWAWPVAVAVPALAICVWYPITEPGVVALAIVEAFFVLLGVLGGGWLARPRGPPARRAAPAGPKGARPPQPPQKPAPAVRKQP